MTLLDRITKLLRKHNARLIIETRNEAFNRMIERIEGVSSVERVAS